MSYKCSNKSEFSGSVARDKLQPHLHDTDRQYEQPHQKKPLSERRQLYRSAQRYSTPTLFLNYYCWMGEWTTEPMFALSRGTASLLIFFYYTINFFTQEGILITVTQHSPTSGSIWELAETRGSVIRWQGNLADRVSVQHNCTGPAGLHPHWCTLLSLLCVITEISQKESSHICADVGVTGNDSHRYLWKNFGTCSHSLDNLY